ncbi:MAG: OmpH family outer membrane protein [Marinifilaceae bacterium]|nr:OmpH family outer membrane protein [Marinifilaceae bacterium]
MKHFSTVLGALSFIGVVVLFVLHYGNASNEVAVSTETVVNESGAGAKIAYVNTDSLLSDKFLLYKEMSETFMKTQEARLTDLNIKAKALDQEAQEWQRKVQNNGFLTEQRAVEARDKIIAKQQELQSLQQEMSDKSAMEEIEMSTKVFDEVTSFLEEYNKSKGYSIILATTMPGAVLYAEQGMDITSEVIEGLNARYKK